MLSQDEFQMQGQPIDEMNQLLIQAILSCIDLYRNSDNRASEGDYTFLSIWSSFHAASGNGSDLNWVQSFKICKSVKKSVTWWFSFYKHNVCKHTEPRIYKKLSIF